MLFIPEDEVVAWRRIITPTVIPGKAGNSGWQLIPVFETVAKDPEKKETTKHTKSTKRSFSFPLCSSCASWFKAFMLFATTYSARSAGDSGFQRLHGFFTGVVGILVLVIVRQCHLHQRRKPFDGRERFIERVVITHFILKKHIVRT